MHTAPYFTVLGLLTIFHSMRVVQFRRKFKVSLGHGNVPELEERVRIFGNHIEYAAMGLILLIGLEFVQAPLWYMHLTGLSLVIGRLAHATGLSHRGVKPGRIIGMTLTWLSLFLSSIGILIFSLTAPQL